MIAILLYMDIYYSPFKILQHFSSNASQMKKLFFIAMILACINLPDGNAQNFYYSGYATYYSDALQGNKTAYGELYDRAQYTCANLKFPKNTLIKVTRLDNGKSVTVRVNDKGPFHAPSPNGTEYIIDLSLAAANAIDLNVVGKAMVKIEQVGFSTSNPVVYNSNSRDNNRNVNSYDEIFTSKGGNTNNSLESFNGNFNTIKTIQPNQGGYGIQVGSYIDRKNAERQVVSLQKIGVQHLYLLSSTNANNQLTYKLIICKFDTRDEATNYMQKVKQQYMLQGFVRRI